ncbi:YybH family protein [Tuwongella immobilis]|nr:SgcJ/EcaC family oxidoreductase [Tuwongella immobilis]
MMSKWVLGSLALLGVGVFWANAQSPTAPTPATEAPAADAPTTATPPAPMNPARAADDAAIRETATALAKAFEKGDAKAVAAFWTAEGEYVEEGSDPIRGQAAIEKAYAAFFAKRPKLSVVNETTSVRFLGADTAVEEGIFTANRPNEPAIRTKYSTLFVREQGKWKAALLKEWSQETLPVVRLADLEWLIGTWEADSPVAKVKTTYEWMPSKTFIRCTYTITPTDAKATANVGMQMIGIDPATQTIHAWTFEEDGSVGDADWTWDGSKWTIFASATLSDGTATGAYNLVTKKGDDQFTWHSVQRTINGQPVPDVGPITVKKVTGK